MAALLDSYVDRAARKRPGAEAFRHGDRSLTYGELATRARRLATWLGARGVERGDRVGIYMQRNLDLPVAVFGAMKAGAAYVPLDPGAPVERIGRIAADCGIGVIVTEDRLAPGLAAVARAAPSMHTALGVTGPVDGLATAPVSVIDAAAPAPDDATRTLDDLAYIIFTSGSTGLPKGVVHTHASASAYAEMSAAIYDLGPGDRMANTSPLHFDMSTFEMFAGPSRGATTVLVPEVVMKLPASLTKLIADERVTTIYTVPFVLIQMLEAGAMDKRDLSALRWVVHAGEPMPPRQLAALQRALPGARFSNSYGPAEVNQVTYLHHPPGPVAEDRAVPLGIACPHSELLIDDRQDGRGELLAATTAMMRGYWNRPDLDARCFVERPGADGHPRRFYRTGDIVRQDADGVLHFIGRRDRQIKLRGFRVELDEVELAIARHPAVSEAAAVKAPDGLTIAAFALLKPGLQADSDDILAHASRGLADYAVPRSLMILPSFPRTTSGKIDRKRLEAEDAVP